MDIQTMLNNSLIARRQEALKTSPQLTLGEMILKLDALQASDTQVFLDFGEHLQPTGIESWRGSYEELALEFALNSGMPADFFLDLLREAVGKTFEGYKGGDFLMGRSTPVWVANYGHSGVEVNGKWETRGVVDIVKGLDSIVIKTQVTEY